ncbi:MAG: hypothetical protein BWK78_05045 [Thiotrichaceae bacterium IS1]|nr:MAG: hypothetical protein BWK78_05045 [Thiotrichaceae bacterium IS1]
MFNFKELKLNKRTDPNNPDPFIGIHRNESHGFEFRLPVGFENFPEGNFDLTKHLFFRMYRSFKKFERDNLKDLQQSETTGKDNIEVSSNASRFKDREGNDIVLYSKISVIETMLEAYQELALNVIERTLQRSEQIDFSKIDRYLHKAIYLDNDAVYLEEMDLARRVLQYKGANLVELFCFILSELQQELEQTVEERVNELSNKFREQHLAHEQSLFNEETFETTIIHLKEILDEIDKTTAYKDDDYWQLYEAVEAFLYGELDMQNTHEEGIFWGINNFWQVWEDMCNTYAFRTFKDVVYADTNVVIDGKPVVNQLIDRHKIFCKEDFENPFFVEFRGNKRWMRPDVVRFYNVTLNEVIEEEPPVEQRVVKANTTIRLLDKFYYKEYDDFIDDLKQRRNDDKANKAKVTKNTSYSYNIMSYPTKLFNRIKSELHKRLFQYIICDWKYHSCSLFMSNNKKVQQDVIKQLSYELALQQNVPTYRIESRFVIPFFYPAGYQFKGGDCVGDFMEDKLLADIVRTTGIKVFKANFFEIQRIYLSS